MPKHLMTSGEDRRTMYAELQAYRQQWGHAAVRALLQHVCKVKVASQVPDAMTGAVVAACSQPPRVYGFEASADDDAWMEGGDISSLHTFVNDSGQLDAAKIYEHRHVAAKRRE